jgi:hypothetical protein
MCDFDVAELQLLWVPGELRQVMMTRFLLQVIGILAAGVLILCFF